MPAPRMGRLSGLRNPRPIRRPRAPPNAKSADPRVKCCDNPQPHAEDGAVICRNCFTEIRDDNIVAEVTFEENAGGRATVQGGTVGENARFAKTFGPGAHRKGIGGERNTLADVQNAGRRALQQLCPKLGIEDNVSIQAESIWTLAANINFSAGRRTDEVVAACLYAACRRQKQNSILLMDIAELLKINVFRLGEVYKDMCKALYLNDDTVGHQYLQELEPLIKKYCDKLQFADKTREVAQDALRIIRRMNRDWIVDGRHPAGLCGACIILAARMNNFQRSVREVVYVAKVADATIAKRVEEFRRTRSAGLTVDQFRLFANRIKQQHDPPALYESEQREKRMAKRKRKREEHMQSQASEVDPEKRRSQQPIEIADDATDASSRPTSLEPGILVLDGGVREDVEREKCTRTVGPAPPPTPPATQQLSQQAAPPAHMEEALPEAFLRSSQGLAEQPVLSDNVPTDAENITLELQPATPSQQAPRYDADGFAIPALPVAPDPEMETETTPPSPKRRGRPKKEAQPPPIIISEQELAEENYLEAQIEKALIDGEVQEAQDQVENNKERERLEAEARAKSLADQQRQIDAEKRREQRMANGASTYWNSPAADDMLPTAEELEKEFENDPEVQGCLLMPEEVRIKEQIWVTHNEDWLRKQAEREMLAKVAKATGSQGKGGRRGKKGEKGAKRKKRSKMGDGSVLTETSTPIETPADAARAMLEKRAPQKSQHVDFSALQRIYGRETPSGASSSSPEDNNPQTRNATPTDGRDLSATPVPSDSEGDAAPGGDMSPTATEEDDELPDYEDEPEDIGVNAASQADAWEGVNNDPEEDVNELQRGETHLGRYLQAQTTADADEFGEIEGGFEAEDYEGYD